MRADLFLVKNGIVPSRQRAKTLIEQGVVYADGINVIKPSQNIDDAKIKIVGDVLPYVSRGGLKLEAAINAFDIDVSSMICLDVGASTGGFTDCLLQNGAAKVYAVDCGHGQLNSIIAADKRVVSIEGVNARYINPEVIPEFVDVCVMDVSFISQILIHPALTSVLKNGAHFVTLIKPQFEVGRSNIGKNGIVKSETARKDAVDKIMESAKACGFESMGVITSPITGGDGNIEYIGYFRYKDCDI